MKIYQAINAIMTEVGSITKDRQGNGINYKFRGIEDVLAKFHPLLNRHKVFCSPEVIRETSETFQNKSGNTSFRVNLVVKHTFYAEDGSNVSATTAGEAIDTSDKASNKAMSAAFKYAFFELFCIPTAVVEDSDYENPSVDGEHHQPPQSNPFAAKNNQPPPDMGTNYDRGYRFQTGKFKLKSAEEIPPKELASWINWWDDQSAKGKVIEGKLKEDLDYASEHLALLENAPANDAFEPQDYRK